MFISENDVGEKLVESQYICSVCDLTETKLSPYAQYWHLLGDDLTLQAGLRYENFEIEVPDINVTKGVLSLKNKAIP